LLTNAIKFSSSNDFVSTKVNVKEIDSENVHVELMVEDNGIGINSNDQKNLFKPYFKTTDLTSK
jgi:signal transduction histidine kinase